MLLKKFKKNDKNGIVKLVVNKLNCDWKKLLNVIQKCLYRQEWWILVLVIGMFLTFFLIQISLSRSLMVHDDEFVYIARANYFDQYKSGDFSNPNWNEFDSYDVPKLGEYLYAGYLYILNLPQGYRQVNQFLNDTGYFNSFSDINLREYLIKTGYHLVNDPGMYYSSYRNTEWAKIVIHLNNIHTGLKDLPKETLNRIEPVIQARGLAVLLSISILTIIFIVGVKISGILYAILLTLLIMANNLYRVSTVRAMGESPLLFFVFLNLLLTLFFIKDIYQNKKHYPYWLTLIGISIGLATATKLNGILCLIYFIIIFILQNFIIKKKLGLVWVLYVSGISFVVFYFINPYIWQAPIHNSWLMYLHRVTEFKLQQNYFTSLALVSIWSRFRVALKMFFLYSNYKSIDLLLGFFAIVGLRRGVSVLIRLITNQERVISSNKCSLHNLYFLAISVWGTVFWMGTITLVPVNWDRYFILPMIVFCFIDAYGLIHVIRKIAI